MSRRFNIKGPCACGGSPANPNRDCERCAMVWTILEAKRTREAQIAYFKRGTGQALQDAKELEKRLDKAIRKLTGEPGTLFDKD